MRDWNINIQKEFEGLSPLIMEFLSPMINEKIWTYPNFLWADSIFGSRNIESNVMIPILDLCNHVSVPNAYWKVFPAGLLPSNKPHSIEHSILLIADGNHKDTLKPGSEVFISYGEKSNEELLFQYGFVEKGNVHDKLVFFLVRMEEDSLWSEKAHILQKLLLPPRLLATEKDFTEEAKMTARVYTMDQNDFEILVKRMEKAENHKEVYKQIRYKESNAK